MVSVNVHAWSQPEIDRPALKRGAFGHIFRKGLKITQIFFHPCLGIAKQLGHDVT
jgi:hypothetical protein